MFSPGHKKRPYKFDPFNISERIGQGRQGIKFERLARTVKPKPLWWLIIVFLLVLIVYWYLNTEIL